MKETLLYVVFDIRSDVNQIIYDELLLDICGVESLICLQH